MSAPKLQRIVLDTKACGPIAVYLHGGRTGKDVAAITVHDLGCNLPGQGDNDPELPSNFQFPRMQQIAEGLSEVCDSLELKHVVLLGDGAGANILARLAMLREDITLGAILIHCTGTTAGFMESLRDKINGWKLNTIGMNPSVESYLLLHRFGLRYVDRYFETINAATTEVELKQAIKKFRQSLRETMNPKNLNKFIQAFMERTNITECIGNMKCPVLFLTGSLASFNHTVYTLYNALLNSLKDEPARRANVEILEIEGPEKVSECVQNFLQGLGVASGAVNRRLSSTGSIPRPRNRSASMDEYDQPQGFKNLLYDNKRKYAAGGVIQDIEETDA
ncbi:hypothetical protein AAHC03_04405 [Spirometra sp. Aus1]